MRRQRPPASATVYGGEYAVLGVAGGEPVFVVVRLKQVPDGRRKVAGDARQKSD